jgi:hypothetical protein
MKRTTPASAKSHAAQKFCTTRRNMEIWVTNETTIELPEALFPSRQEYGSNA